MTLRGTLESITNNNDVKVASEMNKKISRETNRASYNFSKKSYFIQSELINGYTQPQLKESLKNK